MEKNNVCRPENIQVNVTVPSEERFPHVKLLTGTEDKIPFDKDMRQFTVYNDSSSTVYINDSGVASATTYRYRVPAKSIFVSPCFNFNNLSYFLSAATSINPELTAYTKEFMTPQCTQIQAGS